ncbi:MAG TPA: hypothetical protein VM328_01855 [Fimbriimonadaceae bacterium]|nr:hypothetical protein [Fimbriimonadaceae bacterium]
MQPTLYATFDALGPAQAALATLLRRGVQPEDVSLICRRPTNGSREPQLLDDLEGIDTAPEGESGFRPPIESEGSYVYEGRRGGGIATSTRDDSVSGVEEMDEGQEAAEDMIYPSSGTSFSSQEGHDVGMAATTGFFQTTRPSEGTIGTPLPSDKDLDALEEELSPMLVPGIGIVIGSGALATFAETERGDIAQHLVEQGVPEENAQDYAREYRSGKALLAVAVPIGGGEATTVEETLNQYNPNAVVSYPAA